MVEQLKQKDLINFVSQILIIHCRLRIMVIIFVEDEVSRADNDNVTLYLNKIIT